MIPDLIDPYHSHANAIETLLIEVPTHNPVYRFLLGGSGDEIVSPIGIYDARGASIGLCIYVYNLELYRRGNDFSANRSQHLALIRRTNNNHLCGYIQNEKSTAVFLTHHGHDAAKAGSFTVKNTGVFVAHNALGDPIYDIRGVHFGLTQVLRGIITLSAALTYHMVDLNLLD